MIAVALKITNTREEYEYYYKEIQPGNKTGNGNSSSGGKEDKRGGNGRKCH